MNENEEYADIVGRLRSWYRAELAVAESEPPTSPNRMRVQSHVQLQFTLIVVGAVALLAVVLGRGLFREPVVPSFGNGSQSQPSADQTERGVSITAAPSRSVAASASTVETVQDGAGSITLKRPITWLRWQPNEHSPMVDGPLIYLARSRYCPRVQLRPGRRRTRPIHRVSLASGLSTRYLRMESS